MSIDYAERATTLVGTRFRAQGRDTEGLDCVGVVVATFGIDPACVRRDYGLRGASPEELKAGLMRFFRRIPSRRARAGDVLMLRAGRDQMHLAVRTDGGFVHADAGIRRVVETPGEPQWPVLAAFRFRTRARS